jgi:hypothetical protein
MNVLEKMQKIRQSLIERDHEHAMSILTEMLHYKVAPRVTGGDEFTLFRDENQITDFCKNNDIDQRALSWLFDAMRTEGLLASSKIPVILTPLCVEKFCRIE